MYKKLTFLLIVLLYVGCNNQNNEKNNSLNDIEAIIARVQKEILPDSRDAIFEWQILHQKNSLILKGKTNQLFLKQQFVEKLQMLNINFIDSIKLLPIDIFKDKKLVCRVSVANLRAKPKHSSELVTQVLMGTPVDVYEEENGFYRVRTPENYYAWVDKAAMQMLTKNELAEYLKLQKIITIRHCGKIYEKPSQENVISDFVLNNVFVLLKKGEDYSHIRLPDGRTAYIHNDEYITIKTFEEKIKSLTPQQVVQNAMVYKGIPYLWGGTSTKGLDCSGFTKDLLAQAGYLLPRDASQQVKIGKPIPLKDDFTHLQAGDLLFFGRVEKGIEKITHVAVNIENGKMIHASGSVKIESLNPNSPLYNEDRKKTFLQIRRVLGHYPQNFSKIFY